MQMSFKVWAREKLSGQVPPCLEVLLRGSVLRGEVCHGLSIGQVGHGTGPVVKCHCMLGSGTQALLSGLWQQDSRVAPLTGSRAPAFEILQICRTSASNTPVLSGREPLEGPVLPHTAVFTRSSSLPWLGLSAAMPQPSKSWEKLHSGPSWFLSQWDRGIRW